jgi:hypothetical protein
VSGDWPRRRLLAMTAGLGAAGLSAPLAAAPAGGGGEAAGPLLSARSFGALGDGRTDDTRALAAWLAAGSAGRTLFLPAGTYPISRGLAATLAPGRRLRIVGEGAAVTAIEHRGDGDEPILHLTGSMPDIDLLFVGGFQLVRPDRGAAGLGRGAALLLENVRGFDVEDVRTCRTGIGIHLLGCLVGQIARYHSYYDRVGVAMARGGHLSTPNAINLTRCSILAALEVGIRVEGGTLVAIDNTTVEGTGLEGAGDAVGLAVLDAGEAGGVAVDVQACYFEDSHGHDVLIDHRRHPALYRLNGCTFNRVGPGSRGRGLRFQAAGGQGSAAAVLDLSGSAFMGLGDGYLPGRAGPAVTLALGAGHRGVTLADRTALYQHEAEAPRLPPGVRRA